MRNRRKQQKAQKAPKPCRKTVPKDAHCSMKVGEAQQPELSEAEVQEFDVLDQQWKELLKTRPRVDVTNLTQSMPIRSLEAVALMMTRLQALQVPIARVHTDRAKEFVSQHLAPKRLLAQKFKRHLKTNPAQCKTATN